MLYWQESTLKIHILELYDKFDNVVTALPPPCNNLATVSKYKVGPRLGQGCDKVHCGNLVTLFIQLCDNLATTLSQPCNSFKIQDAR